MAHTLSKTQNTLSSALSKTYNLLNLNAQYKEVGLPQRFSLSEGQIPVGPSLVDGNCLALQPTKACVFSIVITGNYNTAKSVLYKATVNMPAKAKAC